MASKINVSKEAEEAIRIFPRLMSHIIQDDQYRCEDFELTISQLRFLRVLHDQGSSNMRMLSEKLLIAPPSATVIADELVRRSLIVRQEDKQDRRVVRIALSPGGKKLMNRFYQAKKKRWTAILTSLKNPDRVRLLTTLHQLLSILEKAEMKKGVGSSPQRIKEKR